MKIAWKETAPLRIPAAVLLAAIAFAWALVGHSQRDFAAAQQQLHTRTLEMEEARRRFQRSDDEKATILKYLPVYQQLQQEGFIGAEHRMDWIDALRAADRQAGLYGVNYDISAQDVYKNADLGGAIGRRLRYSTMQVRFGITHEGDLLEFLRLLAVRPSGVYSVRECTLAPFDLSAPGPRKANLLAQCRIEWLTVAESEEPRT